GHLLNAFKQRRGAAHAGTFWSGCGAVRAAAFRQVGGYDEWQRPAGWIEDADFTCRLRGSGYGVRVRTDIPAAHDRRWTLGDVLTEFFWRRPLTGAWCLPRDQQRVGGTGPARADRTIGAILVAAALLVLTPFDAAPFIAAVMAGGAAAAALL